MSMSSAQATFYRRVEEALADQRLQGALDRATARMLTGRANGMRAFPEAESVRDHAREIRAQTIARLDEYVDRFVTALEARGGQAYYAETAADAVSYVADLARRHGVRTAVKSKSMVSEELELNRHLEAAGVRVVETDLGEFVVQLAHDHPSHIVAPIIHMTRGQIADLFQEKLGATDEEVRDIPQMTGFARRVLRQEFLHADLGISGTNFGVADTGSVCICTNEGNGRLTTSLPRIHVAMMGIERLVPTLADLGVMLQLLGRSATGQKLTVYTNILTGPRQAGEPDGPEQLHVVLVDNGRSRILASELAEILYCIRCGACLNVCPVYQEIGGHAYGTVYPGPVGSVLTPALHGIETFHELPNASSLCGACREVCPVRIDIPRMLLALRARATREADTPAWLRQGLRMFQWMALRPALFRLAGRIASVSTRMIATQGWIRRLPGPLAGWTRARDFPVMATRSFTAQWAARAHEGPHVSRQGERPNCSHADAAPSGEPRGPDS
jgi:L-lactate dehydrogenase complex protein LldF